MKKEILSNKKGFTLIETIVSMMILSLLVLIIMPVYSSIDHQARQRTDQANIRILNQTTGYYAFSNHIHSADIFSGIEQDEERMQLLISHGLIDQMILPQTQGVYFTWNIDRQLWQMTVQNNHGSDSSDTNGASGQNPLPDHPLWDAQQAYSGGTRVIYDNRVFEARNWTRNDQPGLLDSPWQEITDEWRSFNVYKTGDTVIWQGGTFVARNWTQNAQPELLTSPWQEQTDEFRIFNIYQAGDRVIYHGVWYRAKYWTQAKLPGEDPVWEKN